MLEVNIVYFAMAFMENYLCIQGAEGILVNGI